MSPPNVWFTRRVKYRAAGMSTGPFHRGKVRSFDLDAFVSVEQLHDVWVDGVCLGDVTKISLRTKKGKLRYRYALDSAEAIEKVVMEERKK